MSSAKVKAQREELEEKLHKLQVRAGVEEAHLKNRNATLASLHQSYTITQLQAADMHRPWK